VGETTREEVDSVADEVVVQTDPTDSTNKEVGRVRTEEEGRDEETEAELTSPDLGIWF